MRKTEFSTVVDSGQRTTFEGGAVRDTTVGKGRYDLLSPFANERQARHMENGARKYHDRNWEKGMLFSRCLDSANRHLDQYKKCRLLGQEMPEDHLAAVVWNIQAIMHFEAMIEAGLLSEDFDDLPRPKQDTKKRSKR